MSSPIFPFYFRKGNPVREEREIVVYSTITVGADIIRPQPYRIDSTHIHRKFSKTGTFRADNIRPYGSNVRCLKTVNNNLPEGSVGALR